MAIPITDGPEEVVYQTKFFEVIKQPMKIDDKKVTFELVRRPPGVRLIIVKNDKILITHENRWENNDLDYRLPGGKVFDNVLHYKPDQLKDEEILTAAKVECEEETGLVPTAMKIIYSTSPTSMVKWDLHYILVSTFDQSSQKQGLGESIEVKWFSFTEVEQLCLSGKIGEERSALVLLRFIRNQLK